MSWTWTVARAVPMRASALVVAVAALAACGGTAHLRDAAGRLAPCSARNCVSSLETRDEYRVSPLRYDGAQEAAHAELLRTLARLPRTSVVTATPDYVHATVTSPLMHYVDDLEFVLQDGVIHLRSASRTGYYDFGVNRDRVERLRAEFGAPR